MGSYTMHREPGLTTKQFMEREFTDLHFHSTQIVDNVFYAAAQRKDIQDAPIFGLVCLLFKSSGYHNFGYKPMDESVGPVESKCPTKILDLLSPLPDNDKYAADWRGRCREYNAKPKLRAGSKVVFSNPIKFRSGVEYDTFIYEQGNKFISPEVGWWCKFIITGWKDHEYRVVA